MHTVEAHVFKHRPIVFMVPCNENFNAISRYQVLPKNTSAQEWSRLKHAFAYNKTGTIPFLHSWIMPPNQTSLLHLRSVDQYVPDTCLSICLLGYYKDFLLYIPSGSLTELHPELKYCIRPGTMAPTKCLLRSWSWLCLDKYFTVMCSLVASVHHQ